MPKAKSKTPKTPALYLRASAWKTWQQCALSLILKDESPFKPEQDEFAAEGTKIHAAIEADLKGVEREKLDVETEAIIGFAVRATRAEAGELPIRTEVFNSQKVQGVTIGGTADALIDGETTITVIDFKTGWRKIEAQTEEGGKVVPNTQLKIYAHLNRKQGQTHWRGVIINARLNSISMTGPHPFEKTYLKDLATDAKTRAAKKQTQVGNHCAYCHALARCVPVRDAIKKWIVPGADDGIKNRKDDWSELLNLKKPFETLVKRAASDALKYVELGGEIPGVSVELSGGTRAWPNDLSEKALADRLGVPLEKLTTRELLSPKQALDAGVVTLEQVTAVAIQPMRRGLKIQVAKKEKAEGK